MTDMLSCCGRVLRGHRGSVLTLYTAGNLLLSGGRDNIIRVWVWPAAEALLFINSLDDICKAPCSSANFAFHGEPAVIFCAGHGDLCVQTNADRTQRRCAEHFRTAATGSYDTLAHTLFA